MLLGQIITLSILSILLRSVRQKNVRNWILFVLSILFVFWFQPQSSIRYLDYWLPAAVFLISAALWVVLFVKSVQDWRNFFYPFLTLVLIFVIISVLGVINPGLVEELVSPPPILTAGITASIFALIALIFSKIDQQNKTFWFLFALFILLMLLMQKYEPLSLSTSQFLRSVQGQSTELASGSEFVWVGFSYFAFRILHIIFDRDRVKKPNLSFQEFIVYLVFPAAYIAGPIDNIFHFHQEMENVDVKGVGNDLLEGSRRLAVGLFFKFILADSLALIPLSPESAQKVQHPIWMWLIVYSYAFRIFLDFAGYTHIAIGISRYLGIKMPENFTRPYQSENITAFWNRWHMTLTQWIRTYFFNPITRFLRTNFKNIPAWLIILFTQASTMLLIGLWHGVSLNFLIWGLWHGLGLFVHNRWSSVGKAWKNHIGEKTWKNQLYKFASVFTTFNFVALGWVWFALPTVSASLEIYKLMFGF